MLRAFGEVLVELSDFALKKAAVPVAEPESAAAVASPEHPEHITTFHEHLRRVAGRTESATPTVVSPTRTPAPLLAEPMAQGNQNGVRLHFGFSNTVDLPCYLRPVRALDTIIGRVPYGARVSVLVYQGRWAKIERSGAMAWVEKDGLSEELETVFPELEDGIVYDSSHPVTDLIRDILKDEFAARDLLLPLLDIEYVTYRLYQDGRTIAWPAMRPRLSGRWQTILRGVSGVYMDVRPGTHSVMEWINDAGEGHVGMVEAVHPDESIEIATVGERVDGRFSRRKLSKEEWQELRPTFIEIK